MKRIAVFTSGGDAPGMNACIRAVVRSSIHYGIEIKGIKRGYQGMIEGDIFDMTSHSVSNIIQRGGTILKTARSKEFHTVEGRQKAFENLKEHGIEGVVAIGGDGTFTGAHIFGEEHNIPFVGIPGTIDNDLDGTDFTIGYDTAINTVVEAVDRIKDTASSHDRLFFIEVMGRDAGFIALRAGIGSGAEAILIPEEETAIDDLVEILRGRNQSKKTSSIIIVAEGDQEGGAYEVAEKVKSKYDVFDTRVSVLGHLQRGGNPTAMDRVLASRLGVSAVEALRDGKKDVMIGVEYKDISYTPFGKAIKHHDKMSADLLNLVNILAV